MSDKTFEGVIKINNNNNNKNHVDKEYINLTVKPIMVRAFRIKKNRKGSGQTRKLKTVQPTVLIRSEYWEESLRATRRLCLILKWKSPATTVLKTLKRVKYSKLQH